MGDLMKHFVFFMLIVLILLPSYSYAYSFEDAIVAIKSHPAAQSIKENSLALKEKGDVKGSWGDPVFKVAAKNFPKSSLIYDETQMTGIEFGISQKIALTTKYGNIEDAFTQLGKAKQYESQNRIKELVKALWIILIDGRRLEEEIQILEDNLNWVSNKLEISKRLYGNGEISQRALLNIEIRKSEVETALINRRFELKEQSDQLGYLLGFQSQQIDKSTIPWKFLTENGDKERDLKELSLQSVVQAKNHLLTASKLDYIPDFTLSLNYTKRSNLDDVGDFVSASVSFPLPLSGVKHSTHSQADYEKTQAAKDLENYRRLKDSEERRIKRQITKIMSELRILENEMIRFAENSRKLASRSYGLGELSYHELLESELKLRNLLIKRTVLEAKLAKKRIAYKYLVGERFYE